MIRPLFPIFITHSYTYTLTPCFLLSAQVNTLQALITLLLGMVMGPWPLPVGHFNQYLYLYSLALGGSAKTSKQFVTCVLELYPRGTNECNVVTLCPASMLLLPCDGRFNRSRMLIYLTINLNSQVIASKTNDTLTLSLSTVWRPIRWSWSVIWINSYLWSKGNSDYCE